MDAPKSLRLRAGSLLVWLDLSPTLARATARSHLAEQQAQGASKFGQSLYSDIAPVKCGVASLQTLGRLAGERIGQRKLNENR